MHTSAGAHPNTSAFGVEHWETSEISKDKKKAEGYRKTRNTLATLGGTTAGLGAVTGGIALAERKGKDPVGLTLPEEPGSGAKKHSAASTKRFLRLNAAAHGKQTAAAGAIGAGALGLAGAYHRAHKKELSKKLDKDMIKPLAAATGAAALGGATAVGGVAYNNKRKGRKWNDGGPRKKAGTFWEGSPLDKNKVNKALKPETKRKAKDAGRDTATVGLGAGAIGAGAYNTKHLAPAAAVWGGHSHYSHKVLQGEKKDKWRLSAKQRAYYKTARGSAARTAGIKGAGAAASVGAAGLGGKAIYDVAARRKKEKS